MIRVYYTLGIVAVVAVALAIISRNWSCRQRNDGPEIVRLGPYTVKSVSNGTTIMVASGLRDRKTQPVVCEHIAAPAAGQPLFEESRDHLAQLAGKTVTVEAEKERALRNPDPIGTVYGESGQVLQVEQLMAGMAWTTTEAPKDWLAVEKQARKAKRGVWNLKQLPKSEE
jgi:endonuclease YncB( thermonuclease family)